MDAAQKEDAAKKGQNDSNSQKYRIETYRKLVQKELLFEAELNCDDLKIIAGNPISHKK